MKLFCSILVLFVSGCSFRMVGAGAIAHQVLTCNSDTSCKDRLVRDCPTGVVLHSIRQAVEIEYSCKE